MTRRRAGQAFWVRARRRVTALGYCVCCMLRRVKDALEDLLNGCVGGFRLGHSVADPPGETGGRETAFRNPVELGKACEQQYVWLGYLGFSWRAAYKFDTHEVARWW